MLDNEKTIDITIPAGEWEQAIEFYSKVFGVTLPENTNVPTLSLAIPEFEIRLTNDNNKELTTQPSIHLQPVRGRNGRIAIREIHKKILEADKSASEILAPYNLTPTGNNAITISLISLGDLSFLGGKIVCLVHNPDWN